MNKINYVIGDATAPIGTGLKVICHICNDLGRWGAGFVIALSNKWDEPERMYRQLGDVHAGSPMFERVGYDLGNVQFVPVENDIVVANMIAQHGVGYDDEGNPPVRYDALRTALTKVNTECTRQNASLHMPRIGCGLAGGEWSEVEKIIEEVITVPVTVYDLN